MADPKFYSLSHHRLLLLSNPIQETLATTPYNLPQGDSISIKSLIQSLLPDPNTDPTPSPSDSTRNLIRNFYLCLAALASAEGEDSPIVYWIPKTLSSTAKATFQELSRVASYSSERDLVADLLPELLPILKGIIKNSCVDANEEEEGVGVSAKEPVVHAILAAHQFRWLVTQVGYPYLGKLSALVIPCALTALDHWSPEVKEQGMVSFMHLGKNVTAAELGWYEDAILDACQRNITSSDELWYRVVEMSVFFLTCTQHRNPRSSWFERLLNEMLSHLERQPMNKERRIAWLQLIEPVFDIMGIFILAHFRRIFNLFFYWMHADDDQTVLLVLERLHTVIKLTWIRKSPYIERLVDELTLIYKEAAVRKDREVIRSHILELLILLQKCKGLQFEAVWDKHKNDPDLITLTLSFGNQSSEALHSEG